MGPANVGQPLQVKVLFLTEAMDECIISAIPELKGKRFQKTAKEGSSTNGDTEATKASKEKIEAHVRWMAKVGLRDLIQEAWLLPHTGPPQKEVMEEPIQGTTQKVSSGEIRAGMYKAE